MSVHCKGITKNGESCRITANLVNGYCRLHRKQAAAGGLGVDNDNFILERSPSTGIPHYVACAEKRRKRWIVLAIVTLTAALAVTFALIFRNRREAR